MEEVRRITTMKTYPPGKIFYSPKEQGEILFILKKGRVQLYWMSDEGKRVVLGYVEEGTVFGEMALTGQGLYDALAEAVEESLFCDVPSRLIALLLRLRSETGSDTIELTHEQLAERLGVYRETVTTPLSDLRKDGLISIARRHIHLTNLAELEKRACGRD